MKIIPSEWRLYLDGQTFEIRPGETIRYSFPGQGALLMSIDFLLPTKKGWFINIITNGIYTLFFGKSEQLQNGKLDLSFGEYVYQSNYVIDILVTNPTKTKKTFSIVIRKLIPW